MAIRRFKQSIDNAEIYGRITAEGVDTSGEIIFPIGFEAQDVIITPNQSYLRNPHWYGTDNIYLYKLKYYENIDALLICDPVTHKPCELSIFGKAIIFTQAQEGNNIKTNTLPPQSWVMNWDSNNCIASINMPGANYDILGDIFLIYSRYEDIHGDINNVITRSRVSNVEILGENKIEPMKIFKIEDKALDEYAMQEVEPIIFTRQNQSMTILSIDEFDFFILDNEKYIEFKEPISDVDLENIYIVLFNCNDPAIFVKYPEGVSEDSVTIAHENFPYTRLRASYRIR